MGLTDSQQARAWTALGAVAAAMEQKAAPTVGDLFTASRLQGEIGQPLWSGNKAGLVSRYTEYTFACVNLIADAVAQAPLRLFFMREAGRSTDREGKFRPRSVSGKRVIYLRSRKYLQKAIARGGEIVEITQHPILDLFLTANPAMDGYFLSKITVIFLMLTGESYTWMEMDKALNVPHNLWPLPAQWVRPVPGTMGLVDSYAFGRTRTDEIHYPADQVIFHRDPNPRDLIRGYAKLAAIAASDQLHEEMNAYELFLFRNRGEPGGVLQTSQKLTPGQRNELRTEWESLHRGPKRAGRAAVLDKGLEWKQTDISPRDMSFLKGRKSTVDEIAAGFGVPVSMLRTEDVNKANAMAGERQFARGTIRPLLSMMEQKWNQDLVPLYDSRLFLAHDDPVPEDREALLEERVQYIGTGVFSPDDVREQLGEERKGGAMSEHYLPSTLVAVTGGEDDESESPPHRPEDEQEPVQMEAAGEHACKHAGCQHASHSKALPPPLVTRESGLRDVRRRFLATGLRLWQQQARGVIKRIGESFKSVAHGYVRAIDPSDVEEWVGEQTEWAVKWEDETRTFIRSAVLTGAATTLGELPVVGLAFNIDNPRISEWLNREPFEFAQRTSQQTADRLRRALQEGMNAGEPQKKLVDRVERIFGDRKRAERIVRTETKWAYEQGGLEAARQSEVVVAKVWRTNPGACEFCVPYEGVTVELDSFFVTKGERSLPSADVDGKEDHVPRQLDITYRDIDIAQLHVNCICWTEWKLAEEFD